MTCVTMPSRYSSSGTRDDAKVLAENLGVELLEIAIGQAMEVYDELLADALRAAASRTSPRRTCRRGSAATC